MAYNPWGHKESDTSEVSKQHPQRERALHPDVYTLHAAAVSGLVPLLPKPQSCSCL